MFYKYEHLKSLFLYLGYPKTDDSLYAQWEKSRVFLKEMLGAKPEDDLYKMKPTKEQR